MQGYLDIEVNNTIIVALLLFSAMVSCVLCVYIFTKSRSGKVMAFFLCGQILTIIWTVFYIFEILAPTVEIRWIIVCIEYFPLCFVGFVFLHFAYTYTRHKVMSKKWFYITAILPTLNYIAVWTNPIHGYFYYGFRIDGEDFGPITYLIILTTFTYLIIGVVLFLSKKHTNTSSRQKQSLYFVIAILIPVAVHAFHTAGFVNFGFSITLIFVPFSVLLFIVSVLKYQFLDVLPIAINDTINSMLDGMIVVHNNGTIIESNELFFRKVLGIVAIEDISTIEEFYLKIKKILVYPNEIDRLEKSLERNFVDIVNGTFTIKSIYNKELMIYFTSKPIFDYSNQKTATLITFFDMTDIYELYKKLEDKNKELTDANSRLQSHVKTVQQLTTERERNKIMADIHDTLGHSMMELLTLLEVIDLIIEQNQGDILESVEEAIEKGRDSLKEVRSAVSKYKRMGGMT